ncbi:hypothetical protein fugu_016809 [Takifugu bimaculatus]|uniref:KASH domain-containing protein n=1 Tax=Takifugu bimaculatus TaxID=433685 RepID=A0A4Z2BVW1_9TELE|nr:hypothetical protein fugu_016809 [Takifugu bimaculatus]
MKGPEQKQLISSQNLTYLEFEQEAHTEVKEEAVSDAKVSPRDVHDAADSLAGVEPKEESSISLETVNEGKGVTTNEVQSEGTIVMGGASESSALPVPADQKAIDAKESDEDANKNIPGPKMDTMEIEVVSLALPMAKTTSTLEEMASVASPQEVESSSEVICAEQIWTEGTSSLQTHAEAGKDAVETDTQPTVFRSFREVQELWGTEPHSQLLQGMQQEDGPEALMTTSSDLENCRNRLVSKVLSCKNHPIRLEVTAMAQQLQEAQECRDAAQSRLTGLSEARAADADGSDDLDLMEDKWSAALQDAAAVIQQKEAELQLVTDYNQQSQSVKTTLESLRMQLGAAQMSPEESSSEQRERLSSLKKETEESRASLEQMVVAFDTLAPHLSQSERMTAQNEIRDLQESWSSLERDIDRTLIQTELYSVETSNLLSSISNLHTNLETICKDVEAKYPDAQWSCRKAKELLVANAEVKAAQQQHLQLQRLSEPLSLNSCWEKELTEVQQGLQKVRDQLAHTEGLVTSCMQRSGNPIMEKMMVVMKDGLSWAKQTECIIEGRRTKVALLPEEVHQQLRDLKKLQLEVIAKQGQLRTLVEEVTELLPELDQAEEVPVVNSTLELLQELSKLTTEKLTSAVGQVESGLQTREKLTEQIADLDSWVMAHLLREASKSADEDLSLAELDRRSGQTQENVVEAEKQLTVCEDLLMKINDISSELSITENSKLLKKLTNLKEDIQAIRNYERANKKDLNDHTQVIALSNEGLNTVEKSLMQMLVDVGRHRYPITKDSLQALEPLKHMVLEHKSQIDLLQPWVPQERVKELYSVVSELLSKMAALERNSRDHETYLSMRQCVEDLRENIQEQVHQTKGASMGQEERYKLCQTLILKIPLIKSLSEETHSKLQMISASLYPSQLNAEQQRLKLHQESLETLEVTLHNNLSIIERDILEDLDLDSEEKATLAFLQRTQKELQRTPVLEPDEAAVQKEYQKIMTLKVMIKSRMRVVEFLRTRKRPRLEGEFQNLKDLKDKVISECDSKMVNISQAREPLRSYTCAVKQAAQFLRDIKLSLQPPQGPAGLCSERIEETQRAVHALQQHFQIHVEHLQDQVIVHPYLSPQKVQQLQETILSQLLVRMSTLQAKGHIQLEHLSRCAENNRKYTQCHEETLQSVKDIEENLLQVTRQKLAFLADCVEQHDQLTTLGEEVEAQLRCLKDLKECCTEQSCSRRREATLAALWRRLSRLHHCTWKLATRSEDRITEWSEISDTVEKASVVLEQVEAELPDGAGVKASSEELQDLLQSWEQYQDRLDCEQRALSALELRTARLLGVPAHLEQAPPTPLCQKLQMMQARYSSVKKRSGEGLEVARMELEEREKVREELHGVQLWLEAADVLLNEMEQGRSTEELQEVHRQLCTQKALLQAMMDRMKRKYSDVQLLVPVELHGLLQEVQQSVQELEVKVVEAVDRSGPAYRLDAKLSEIQTGLRSVRQKLEQRSSTVAQAEDTQKRVWDELDTWHSCLAQLESDAQDLEKPEDTVTITDKLTEVQQLHSQLAKQAERRTALIGKVNPWLQEHQEMINSSDSWMSEAQSWLAAPCTYAGAKCLSGRVRALQRVLDDSAQIRTALQGFGSVLEEMSQVCDVTALQEQLLTADRRVAEVQERFAAPLSQLQHAVTKVESIEREVRQLEKDVAEIKKVLVSPESCPSLQKQRFKMVEQRVGSMRATVAQIQRCKPDLGLPGNAEETLTVFTVVNQLQILLQDLEKKVPALFTQQPLNPAQSRVLTAEQTSSSSPISESSHLEAERDQTEGRIGIAHLGEDVLKRSGAALLTVERPEQRSPAAPQVRSTNGCFQEPEVQVGQTGRLSSSLKPLRQVHQRLPQNHRVRSEPSLSPTAWDVLFRSPDETFILSGSLVGSR